MMNPLLRPQAATAGFFMGNYILIFIVFLFVFCQTRKKTYLCRVKNNIYRVLYYDYN